MASDVHPPSPQPDLWPGIDRNDPASPASLAAAPSLQPGGRARPRPSPSPNLGGGEQKQARSLPQEIEQGADDKTRQSTSHEFYKHSIPSPSRLDVPLGLRAKERVVAPFWRLYKNLQLETHPLLYLFWEATLRCNHQCRHCGSDCSNEPRGPELDAKTALRVFQEIAEKYKAPSIMVVVTGGEPLVRPDLLDVMARVRAMGFKWGLVTNGWAVTPELARRCQQAGIQSLVVSLDGPRAQHEWLRRKKGSFDRVINALGYFRDAGIRIVEAITCVHRGNLDYLEQTYALVKEARATHWRIFNIFPAGRARNNPDLLLDAGGLRRLLVLIAALRKRGRDEGLVVNYSEEGYLDPCLDVQVRDARYFCRAGINVAGLLADGSVAACPNLPRHLVQGNVLERSFVDIWENEYRPFRDRSWMKQGACTDCDHWNDCLGNAMHGYDWQAGVPSRCHLAETQELTRGRDRRGR